MIKAKSTSFVFFRRRRKKNGPAPSIFFTLEGRKKKTQQVRPHRNRSVAPRSRLQLPHNSSPALEAEAHRAQRTAAIQMERTRLQKRGILLVRSCACLLFLLDGGCCRTSGAASGGIFFQMHFFGSGSFLSPSLHPLPLTLLL